MNASEILTFFFALFAAVLSTRNFIASRREQKVETTPYWVNLPPERQIIVVKHSSRLSQEHTDLLRKALEATIKDHKILIVDKEFEFSGLIV